MLSKPSNQNGGVIVLIAVSLFVLLCFAALAIDVGRLVVARNELQNAADAGALAGARFLYKCDGTVNASGFNDDCDIGPGSGVSISSANQLGYDAATANKSEKVAVDANWTSGTNGQDVQRGHWSFGLTANLDRGFYPNSSTAAVNLNDVSTAELDANINFINAVRVVARRQATPVASFFARILGHEDFQMSAEAVAYVGFAGILEPGKGDQPIAICEESIEIDDEYSCNIGRMLNSGSDTATHNTAGWTNFSQPCETANANEMKQLVCGSGNSDVVEYGQGMGATGGVQQVTFTDLRDCWIIGANDLDNDGVREKLIDTDGNGIPDLPWNQTLPVVSCPGNNVSNCATLRGVVNLDIIWITEAGTPDWEDAPRKMSAWPTAAELAAIPDFDTNGEARWNSFVTYFNLRNVDDLPAPYAKKSIYFLPNCDPHIPTGNTGGQNFGILAKIPVLVR
jgi:hypothetical protein